MKKFYASLAALTVAASAIVLFNFLGADSSAALPRDCDNNSIIYCGGINAAELAQRYNENKTGDLPAIYQNYGLSAHDMTNAGTVAKMGEVRKDGTVVVNGEVVATGAMSIGRQQIAGSSPINIGGKTYYNSPPSTSFNSNAIAAYVFFDGNGEFKSFVLTSCANPGGGTPKKKPAYKCDALTIAKISRTEYSFTAAASAANGAAIESYTYDFGDGQKVTSTATNVKHTYAKEGNYTAKVTVNVKVGNETKTATGPQCEKQVVVEKEPEEPVYTCDSLTATRISRNEYSFNGAASASGGATIKDYVIDFGDSKSTTVTNPSNVKHTYAKGGTYTAKLTVTVKVAGAEKTVTDAAKCVVKVIVTPDECKPGIPVGDVRCTPCEVPGKEQYPKNSPECATTPLELPRTGPMDMIGGGFGLGSVIAATYYWRASRKNLLAELLNR